MSEQYNIPQLHSFTRSTLPNPAPLFDRIIVIVESDGSRHPWMSNGISWIQVDAGGGGGGGTWGSITGTLSAQTDLNSALGGKQATLVSGTSIKTINGVSLLGSGDIVIAGGAGSWGAITGTLSAQTDLQSALNLKADLASPALTGVPVAPTAAGGTSTTQIATTAFSSAAITTERTATRTLTGATISGASNTLSVRIADLSDTSAFIKTLMDDADAATARATLGVGAGSGDASTNTATSVDGEVAVFSGTSGKTLKRATISGIALLASGVLSAATAGTDYYAPAGTDVAVTDGGTGRSTGTTAYSLVATGTTATGAQQTLANGATTTMLVGGGASALPVWTTATGTGAPVRASSPTIDVLTTTGICVSSGSNVTSANAMGALAIDVTKGLNTKSISVDSTLTFSGTPATSDTWFMLHLKNTDTAAHAITIPSSFSLARNQAITVFHIPASGQSLLVWRYDGSQYQISGETGALQNISATVAPTTTDDITKGYEVGSIWSDTTADHAYICTDSTTSTAVWLQLDGGGGGSGDVVGQASSVDSEIALFSGTGGKTIKRATGSGLAKVTSGVFSVATGGTDYWAPGGTDVAVADGGTGLSAGTSGGILAYTATGTLASSAALTANSPVLGGGAGVVPKVVAGLTTDGTSVYVAGVAGNSVGGIDFKNATSGTISIRPVTGALGAVTLSLPAATDTLVGRATTDTLTNKTLTSPVLGGTVSGTYTIGGTPTFPATVVITTSTQTLTAKIYSLAALPGTNNTYEGTGITGLNAGATIAQWEAVYLSSSSTWLLADANGSGTYPCRGLAVAAYVNTNAAVVVDDGTVRNDTWTWTPGGDVYLSTTAGALTQTAPSTTGDKIQKIGYALTADSIRVNIGTGEYLTAA